MMNHTFWIELLLALTREMLELGWQLIFELNAGINKVIKDKI